MIDSERALPGREAEMPVPERHAVLGTPLRPPFPEGIRTAIFGLGCFWGAERAFWQLPGVYTTAVGYAGGFTPNPTYEEVCSGSTGHTEAVLVVFDPAKISYEEMLRAFWEGHDPTQGMRQGNDVGTQYRSAIYWADEEQRKAARSEPRDVRRAPEGSGLRRRSRPRSPRPARSTTPRTTTSSTCRRTPAGTAGSAGPASAARSVSASLRAASSEVASVGRRRVQAPAPAGRGLSRRIAEGEQCPRAAGPGGRLEPAAVRPDRPALRRPGERRPQPRASRRRRDAAAPTSRSQRRRSDAAAARPRGDPRARACARLRPCRTRSSSA